VEVACRKLGYITPKEYICSDYPQGLLLVHPWSHMIIINVQGVYWVQRSLYNWLWVMLMSINVDTGDCTTPEAIHMLMTLYYYYIGILH